MDRTVCFDKKPKNPQRRLLKAPPSLQTGVTMMPEGKRKKRRLLWSSGSSVAETGQENGLRRCHQRQATMTPS